MQCPACSSALSPVEAAPGLIIDWCQSGCRGLWFDNLELQQIDETHEHPHSPILAGERELPTGTAPSRKARQCPRCETVTLFRHHFSVKREILVDSCPQCGGHWLDAGELAQIRSEFKNAAAREDAAMKEIEQNLEPFLRERDQKNASRSIRKSRLLPLVEWVVNLMEG